jgi:hypothetical protein
MTGYGSDSYVDHRKVKPLPLQTLVIITMTILVIGLLIPCYVLAHTRRVRMQTGAGRRRRGSELSLEEVYVGADTDARRRELEEEVPPPYKARESLVEPPPPCYHEDAGAILPVGTSLPVVTALPSTIGNTVVGTGPATGPDGRFIWPQGRRDERTPAEIPLPQSPVGDGDETITEIGTGGRFVWPQGRRL